MLCRKAKNFLVLSISGIYTAVLSVRNRPKLYKHFEWILVVEKGKLFLFLSNSQNWNFVSIYVV